jgi:hypothetical protein
MSKKLTISVSHEIEMPAGTKVISNGEWVTLARKLRSTVRVFTCLSEDISSYDLFDDDTWTQFTKEELKKLSAL